MSRPLRPTVVRAPRHSIRWALELLWALSVHRINLRYRETVLGIGWIFFQPVALTIIFTYIFKRFAQVSSGAVPYPLFTAMGLVAWALTALVVGGSIGCLAGNHALLKRLALPRILFPISTVVATLADLGILAILLLLISRYYHAVLPVTAPWALLLLAIHMAFLVGVACLTSLANVFLKDVGHAVPSLLQLWFFASPVFYPASMVPHEFSALARWNPMTGLIEGYRAVLLAGQPPPWLLVGPAMVTTAVILALALVTFRRLDRTMADLL